MIDLPDRVQSFKIPWKRQIIKRAKYGKKPFQVIVLLERTVLCGDDVGEVWFLHDLAYF